MKQFYTLAFVLFLTGTFYSQSPLNDGIIVATENFDAVTPPTPASNYFNYGSGTSNDFKNTIAISAAAANGTGQGVEFFYDSYNYTDEEISLHTFKNIAPGDYIIQYDINADFQGFSFESVISNGTDTIGTNSKPQTVGIQNGHTTFQKRYTAQLTLSSTGDITFTMQMSPFVTGFTSSQVYIDNIVLIKMNDTLSIANSCATIIQQEDYNSASTAPNSTGFTSFTNSVKLSSAADVAGTGQGVEFSYTAFYNEVPATIDLVTFNSVAPGTYYIQYDFDESNTQTFVALSYYNEISDGTTDSLNYIVLDTVTGFAKQRTYPITITTTSNLSLRFLAGETYNNVQGATSYYIDNVQLIQTGGSGNTTATDTQVACGSYTWIDGVTYTSSNTTAMHTIPNASGCDSIITLDLTINYTPDPPVAASLQIYAGNGTIADLTATGTSLAWYDNPTGGSALVSTTALIDDSTYYVSQTDSCGESARIAVLVNRISDSNQTFCSPATVADLVTTPSTGATVSWYNSATGGTALASTTSLATGNYYVSESNEAMVSTFAGTGTAGSTDGAGSSAQFNFPSGVTVDASGNVYVADFNNNKIRKITPAGVVSTMAGTGTAGSTDGPGTSAQFDSPSGVAVDASGNVYVADNNNHKIRKITPAGVVSTLAGTGLAGSTDGPGASAQFNKPSGIAVDASGNVYVADYDNHKIRKITPAGVVSTLAGTGANGSTDGPGTSAEFSAMFGVTVDASGNVYVADVNNNKIRKITPAGVVSTLAGTGASGSSDGAGASAQFSFPSGVTVDASGNVFVADYGNNKIRKITLAGVVSTLAGSGTFGSTDGPGTSAQFNSPFGVTVDTSGNVYVAGYFNHKIRKITSGSLTNRFLVQVVVNQSAPVPTADAIQIYAGNGTIADLTATGTNLAWYDNPTGGSALVSTTALVDDSTYYVSQTDSCGESGRTAVLVNRISDSSQTLCSPATIADLITTPSTGATVSWYNSATGGTALASTTSLATGNYYVSQGNEAMVSTFAGTGTAGSTDGAGASAQFNSPYSTAFDASGNLYVADNNNHKIRKITPAGIVSTFAGTGTAGSADGAGTSAQFRNPSGIAVDASGNVYVADYYNHKIRKITPAGIVSTFAGSGIPGSTDGAGTSAQFNGPFAIAIDASGNLYVGDDLNHKIRKITPTGIVSTLAGTGTIGSTDGAGTSAQFNHPYGVAVDASGNVYVADFLNHKIRKITPAGVVSTLAGTGTTGTTDGAGTSAQFYNPTGVTIDAAGNVYVADAFNHKIRKITPAGIVSTVAGTGTAGSTDGAASSARLSSPIGVTVDASGNLYVAELSNNKIRKISPPSLTNRVIVAVVINQPTTNTITATACNSYTGVSGTTWTMSGTYTDTIPNAIGCDSVTTYNLTINYTPDPPVAASLQIYAGNGTLADLTATGTSLAWYDNPTGGSALASTTALVDDSTYYVSQTDGCGESARTAVLVNRISDSSQTLCSPATVADLVTTPSTGASVSWYNSATGGTALANTTSLATGSYYVSQGNEAMVSTFAGTGTAGSSDGAVASAQFNRPRGVALDASGNVYVADYLNHKIRKITPAGVVSTLAGTGTAGSTDGAGTSAQFNYPIGVAVDASGNVYVADASNHKIRKITPAGVVSTLAGTGTAGSTDGAGTSAQFNTPVGVAVDASGSVYVADYSNDKIRKISPAGVVSTFAGTGTAGATDGAGASAQFNNPIGVAVDASGNVYVADYVSHKIRKITPSGVVSTLAGTGTAGSTDGAGTSAQFNYPIGVAIDASGNVYVGDYLNHKIRKITPAGVVSTLAGTGTAGSTDGAVASAQFYRPAGVTVDASGNVYVADYNNHKIRKITPESLTNRVLVAVMINQPTTNTITATVCNSYTGVSGTTWTMSGTYTDTIPNAIGCDSITTYNLTINTEARNTVTATVCDTYTGLDGAVWTMSGTYVDTIPSLLGCDSITTYNLTINPTTTNTVTATVCDSYTGVAGITWTTSGTFMDTIPNANGCDSVTTYNLTINHPTTNVVTTTACDSYTGLDGAVWTTSGTYMDTIPNANGCDSITTYNLTINYFTTNTVTATQCNSYTGLSGTTWTTSGTFMDTINNANGCDSITTYNLTINYFTTNTVTVSNCYSYTGAAGKTWTTSGTYIDTIANSSGCDLITTYNLTIYQTTYGTEVQTACDSYTWVKNGMTYTASTSTPTWTIIGGNSNGCDSVVTLNLTIKNSTTSVDFQTACDSYTWINGTTYTSSTSTATHTVPNSIGCDSVITLNLTINNSSNSVDTHTACGSFTWIDGNTYTSSTSTPTWTIAGGNSVGCDSVVRLNLTVIPLITINRTKYSCFSYTVPETGNTYTTSGVYKDSILNASTGCYNYFITNLTINTVTAGAVSSNLGVLSVPANGDFYRWLDCDNGFIPVTFGDSMRSYTPVSNGNYACMVFTHEGCIDTTACFSVNNVGLNDTKLSANAVNVYPNPSNSMVTISFDANNERYSVKLYSSIGKLIDERITITGQEQFDVSNLASGQYLIVISGNNNTITKKLIVTD